MNTKQLTYPSIKIQEQFWIDKEAQSNNATTETRDEPKRGMKNTTPEFQREINQIATDSISSVQYVYELWREYASSGQSASIAEFKRVYADKLGTNAPVEDRKAARQHYLWQNEDLMFRFHNDPKFHRFVQEIVSYALERSKRRDDWPTIDEILASHLNQSEPPTADPKLEELSRTESLTDWYDHGRNDFDRGDLRDEGRNPDGEGESYAARNV